jgi:hypothetical protein
VPGREGSQQRAGPVLVGLVLEQEPSADGGERRLGDRRDPAPVVRVAAAPPARVRQVASIWPGDTSEGLRQASFEPDGDAAAEGDVGHHPLPVARAKEGFELGPRPSRVEFRPAQYGERGVPIPLVRIGETRRDGIAALVIR